MAGVYTVHTRGLLKSHPRGDDLESRDVRLITKWSLPLTGKRYATRPCLIIRNIQYSSVHSKVDRQRKKNWCVSVSDTRHTERVKGKNAAGSDVTAWCHRLGDSSGSSLSVTCRHGYSAIAWGVSVRASVVRVAEPAAAASRSVFHAVCGRVHIILPRPCGERRFGTAARYWLKFTWRDDNF